MYKMRNLRVPSMKIWCMSTNSVRNLGPWLRKARSLLARLAERLVRSPLPLSLLVRALRLPAFCSLLSLSVSLPHSRYRSTSAAAALHWRNAAAAAQKAAPKTRERSEDKDALHSLKGRWDSVKIAMPMFDTFYIY